MSERWTPPGCTLLFLLTPNHCRRYVSLLRDALSPAVFGRHVYFSYGADLTLSTERWNALASPGGAAVAKLPAARADPRFFWNKCVANLAPEGTLPCHPFP